MADMLLTRSAAPQVIECAPGARFVFTFPADAATLSRSGDDLVLNVEGGSTITLSDFYGTYTQEEMPSFAVDGAEVAGADFFAALEQPELMPAAGPEPANDSHYQEWSNMDLLGGLDRLGGLDVGWQDPAPRDDEDGGLNSGDINYPVRLFAGEYGSDEKDGTELIWRKQPNGDYVLSLKAQDRPITFSHAGKLERAE